jgi:hypothetical protein
MRFQRLFVYPILPNVAFTSEREGVSADSCGLACMCGLTRSRRHLVRAKGERGLNARDAWGRKDEQRGGRKRRRSAAKALVCVGIRRVHPDQRRFLGLSSKRNSVDEWLHEADGIRDLTGEKHRAPEGACGKGFQEVPCP